jgi:hypothetical protein
MSIGGIPGGYLFLAADVRVAVRTKLMLALILIATPYFAVGIAEAHGGGPGLGYDPCVRQSEAGELIHMAVYQPQFNPFAEYCSSLPRAGPALLVFDLIGADLPEARVSLDVSQEGGPLKLSMPARRYHSGVAALPADLPAGRYHVLVSIEKPDGRQHFAFPLVVGVWWGRLFAPLVIVLLVGIVTACYCVFQIRSDASERSNSPFKNPVELRQVGKDH